jgi:hypothetical protein
MLQIELFMLFKTIYSQLLIKENASLRNDFYPRPCFKK